MLLLIENGDVYTPEPAGRQALLLAGEKLIKLGAVDRRALDSLAIDYDVIDAAGCLVTPGLIDPHEHLLGGSGEGGFNLQTPEIHLAEIVVGGITTVVGCLGVDTTMKTLPGLLARAKALAEEGLTAYIWTGGYNVPPTTLLDSVRNDILFVAEVLGTGEVAISDERSTDPRPEELARLVSDTYVGGLLSRKAGVTHFHVGTRDTRLSLLRTLFDDYSVKTSSLYPTHVNRNKELLREGIQLTRRGCFVDMDTTEQELSKWLKVYFEGGGVPARLTVSTDSAITSPLHLHGQLRSCVLEHGFEMEQVLPLMTANTSEVLKLPNKGRLEVGRDADVLILEANTLEVVEVVARGKRLVRDGKLAVREAFLEQSDRAIQLTGAKAPVPVEAALI